MAEAGSTVFASSCVSCHGDAGQGVTAPPIIGAGANLGKFDNAQGLFDFISTAMPGDAPGSLPEDQYQQVTGYLLVENEYTAAGDPFSPDNLTSIPLN